MRIGEGIDKTERWVPVVSLVCQLVERIRSLRPPDAPHTGRLLLPRGRGRYMLPLKLRAALQNAQPLLELQRALSHTTFDTNMPLRCSAPASLWPPLSSYSATKVPI